MTRLVKVELRRLFARRLTLVGIAGALVIVGLMLFATYKDAQPLSAPEQQRAQREYEQARAEWERSGPEQIQNCKLTERSTLPDGSSPCDHLEPRPEYFGRSSRAGCGSTGASCWLPPRVRCRSPPSCWRC